LQGERWETGRLVGCVYRAPWNSDPGDQVVAGGGLHALAKWEVEGNGKWYVLWGYIMVMLLLLLGRHGLFRGVGSSGLSGNGLQ